MKVTDQLAKHLRAVFFGGNGTGINLKDVLSDITFQEANCKVNDLNTILALTYHIGYYVTGVIEVFNNRPLLIRDKFSYDHPDIESEDGWYAMYNSILEHAEILATHIEALPEEQIWKVFVDEKYGNYFRNINGIIEHTHYHLGQISLIKKMVRSR